MIGAHPEKKRWELPPRILDIIRQECAFSGIEVGVLLSRARPQNVVLVRRRIAARLAAQGMSLSQIGRYLGITHTSVVHHLRVYRGQYRPVETLKSPEDDCGLWAI